MVAPQKIADIEYVLFDMDGLMIDSERMYTIVTNKIIGRYGKEMTWDIKAGCMGKPDLEASKHLLSFFPDIPISIEDYIKERNELQDKMWPTVPLLPGVSKLVKHLKKHNIPMAIATGSRRGKYKLKTGHLQEVFGLFEGKVVCGDDKQYGMRGKPFPDIFLAAAKEMLGVDVGELNAEPSEAQKAQRSKGLVLEDGLPGMQAGKRAGMNVLWVPDPNLRDVEDVKDGPETADLVISSLESFRPEQWGLPPYDDES
ncbi:HAD-like protein [Coprinellus micaceus]|uniref:HAD-like protein n=1 Tax=Coprinellus micaceus TaxID=71717 RepID=A0A4Y7TTQ3_COPMI|nr:HAD-like protein [Coprinellus micaceus]